MRMRISFLGCCWLWGTNSAFGESWPACPYSSDGRLEASVGVYLLLKHRTWYFNSSLELGGWRDGSGDKALATRPGDLGCSLSHASQKRKPAPVGWLPHLCMPSVCPSIHTQIQFVLSFFSKVVHLFFETVSHWIASSTGTRILWDNTQQ